MEQLAELNRGLEILNPFLSQHNFELDNFMEGNDASEHFTIVSYKNENKKFIIDYRFSIGQVLYQYEHSIVSHPFYLDHLGFAEKKQHKDILNDGEIIGFQHLLHDFDYLVDDFFKGKCDKLLEISKLQDSIISEADRKVREESSIIIDNHRIDGARKEFRNKNHKKCLDIYKAVEHKNLMVELDNKIIEYCKRHVNDSVIF